MKKTKKHITLAIIAIIIAALAFGYAYLTTTLSINGITDIDRNSWDVYFDNVQVTDGSVSGAQEIEAPTITSDTEVEFHVNLKKPGDFYEFTIEARNDGTIDAMINSVSKKLNGTEITTLPSYLNYTVTYEDDLEIEDNHLLPHESLETYKIRVEYKKNISASDLPSTAQSLTLSFGVEYIQADDNAKKPREVVYTAYSDLVYLNQSIPNTITQYQTLDEALAAFTVSVREDTLFCLKHVIVNNKVYASYIEYKITDEMALSDSDMTAGIYDLRLGISTQQAFENNKQVLISSFGVNNLAIYDYLVVAFSDNPHIQVNMWNGGNIEMYGGNDPGHQCNGTSSYSICQFEQS